MNTFADQWYLHFDVGPEWLFFRIGKSMSEAGPTPRLAERIWEVAENHRIHRIVIELEAGVALTSYVVGQLVLLSKRVHQVGGVTRICGFDTTNYDVLRIMNLNQLFPNYATRHDAVMGYAPESN